VATTIEVVMAVEEEAEEVPEEEAITTTEAVAAINFICPTLGEAKRINASLAFLLFAVISPKFQWQRSDNFRTNMKLGSALFTL
jgi:hypothetical protein